MNIQCIIYCSPAGGADYFIGILSKIPVLINVFFRGKMIHEGLVLIIAQSL